MKPGSVLVDIAIDQGGCFEDSRPTTHADPVYKVHESIFYCVANMPGAVPHTSTYALTNVTLPYAVDREIDDIEAWFDQTDVDGLNVPFAVSPGDFEDITDMLVPELVRRGRYKNAYRKGTLREKLFGDGRARLRAPHPATGYRVGTGKK